MKTTKEITQQNEFQKAVIAQAFDGKPINEEEFLKEHNDWFDENGMKRYFQDIEKAITEHPEDKQAYLEKAQLDISKLHKKIVMIQGPHGPYQAVRWVSTDSPEQHQIEQKIQSTINQSGPMTKKLRDLVKLGIYDRMDLINMTGAKVEQVYEILRARGITKEIEGHLKKLKSEPMGEVKESGNGVKFKESNLLMAEMPAKVQWKNYRRIVKMVVNKERNVGIFYGKGGAGKSFTYERILEEEEKIQYDPELAHTKEEYDYVVFSGGKITPTNLYQTLIDHNGKLVILDDTTGLFDPGSASIDIIKGAGETKRIRQIIYKGMNLKGYQGDPERNYPKVFNFTGQLIVVTNLPPEKMPQPILTSRAVPADLTMNKDGTLEKIDEIKYVMELFDADGNLLDGEYDKKAITELNFRGLVKVDKEARDASIKFLHDYKDHIDIDFVNVRTFGHLIAHYRNIMKDTSIPKVDKQTEFINAARIQTQAYIKS